MSIPANGDLEDWDEWKRADAQMVILVQAALRAKIAATTAADRNTARAAYDSLLDQWERLKSIGMKRLDAEIATSGLVGKIKAINDEVSQQAGKIAATAKTITDIAGFVGDIAKVALQVNNLIGLLATLVP